ncbi:hypothetical protein HYU95_02630 [Candidatus Daviesbacteria bacterium]|nr:hypothetical protein [Candidatus Daviesbacteria bacterium]
MDLKRCLFTYSFIALVVFAFLPSSALAAWNFDATPPTCDLYPKSAIFTVGELISIYTSSMSADVASTTLSSIPPIAGLTLPFPWNTAGFATGDYKFTLRLVDTAGNVSTDTSCAPITITLSAIQQPWLKTTGGDVHSNKEINSPQGP